MLRSNRYMPTGVNDNMILRWQEMKCSRKESSRLNIQGLKRPMPTKIPFISRKDALG